MTLPKRPDVDEYFLKIASVVANVPPAGDHMGAIAVRDKHILTTGYNGAPAGAKDCLELGCLRDQNGIASGRRGGNLPRHPRRAECDYPGGPAGVSLEGETLLHPYALRALRQDAGDARIARFVTFGKYADDEFIRLFQDAGIKFEMKPRPSDKITFLD